MRRDSQDLFEFVLGTVMQGDSDALQLAAALKSRVPEARASAVIRALLAADRTLSETFNGSNPGRADADLARRFALTLAEQADDLEHQRNSGVRLGDLAI